MRRLRTRRACFARAGLAAGFAVAFGVAWLVAMYRPVGLSVHGATWQVGTAVNSSGEWTLGAVQPKVVVGSGFQMGIRRVNVAQFRLVNADGSQALSPMVAFDLRSPLAEAPVRFRPWAGRDVLAEISMGAASNPSFVGRVMVTGVMVPLAWVLTGVLGMMGYWLWRASDAPLSLVAGICRGCEYDIRATPGRCPECGMQCGVAAAVRGS